MLEEARWFSPFYPSPDCCLRSFLAVTCRVAILTHPVHLVTTEIEIAMSSVNLQLISGKSSETWTESRRLATGATRTAIPGGRFGDKQKLPPCVNSCASVMILTCRDIHLSPAVKATSATPCARQDVTDGPSVLDYTQRTDDLPVRESALLHTLDPSFFEDRNVAQTRHPVDSLSEFRPSLRNRGLSSSRLAPFCALLKASFPLS